MEAREGIVITEGLRIGPESGLLRRRWWDCLVPGEEQPPVVGEMRRGDAVCRGGSLVMFDRGGVEVPCCWILSSLSIRKWDVLLKRGSYVSARIWVEEDQRKPERIKERGRGSYEINISGFIWPDTPFQVGAHSCWLLMTSTWRLGR